MLERSRIKVHFVVIGGCCGLLKWSHELTGYSMQWCQHKHTTNAQDQTQGKYLQVLVHLS